jgi:hypothetical protein
MPICKNCGHRGEDHNWTIPPAPPARLKRLRDLGSRRIRGHCFCCACIHYVPWTDRPQPINRVIGRMLRRRR